MSNESNKLLYLLRNANDAFDLVDCVVVLVRNGRDSREHAVVFQQQISTRISVLFTNAAAPVGAVIERRH